MGLSFIYGAEKKALIEKLEYYGIKKIPYLLSVSGKDKIRGYSGAFSDNEIIEFDKEIGIDIFGLYLFHDHGDEVRLSFDGMLMLKDQITKNIFELTDTQAIEFFRGQDILLTNEEKAAVKDMEKGFKVLKHNGELIGTGKLLPIEGRIVNYLPKERRIKK
jgi:NOL1/NOP2/fmu family ribosome biogenesis protein